MPEHTNFVLFFDGGTELPAKDIFIDIIFLAASRWLTEPETYMILNWELGSEITGNWSSFRNKLSQKLSENEILTIHSKSMSTQGGNSLTIHEGFKKAIYTISVNHDHILDFSIPEIEEWLLSLYKPFSNFAPVIAAGSETELNLDIETNEEATILAMSSFLNCYWVLTSVANTNIGQSPFQITKRLNEAILFRNANVLQTLNFKDSE
jgi:hypothetical protein